MSFCQHPQWADGIPVCHNGERDSQVLLLYKMAPIHLTSQEMATTVWTGCRGEGLRRVLAQIEKQGQSLCLPPDSSLSEALSVCVSFLQPNELTSVKTQGPLRVGQAITNGPHYHCSENSLACKSPAPCRPHLGRWPSSLVCQSDSEGWGRRE